MCSHICEHMWEKVTAMWKYDSTEIVINLLSLISSCAPASVVLGNKTSQCQKSLHLSNHQNTVAYRMRVLSLHEYHIHKDTLNLHTHKQTRLFQRRSPKISTAGGRWTHCSRCGLFKDSAWQQTRTISLWLYVQHKTCSCFCCVPVLWLYIQPWNISKANIFLCWAIAKS